MTDLLTGGLLDSGWLMALAALLVTTHVTILSVSIYLHRTLAHAALDLHPAMAHFFRAWLWLTTGTNTRAWVAIHRKHHAYCETPNDPHSPVVEGLKTVLTEGYELYVKAADQETLDRFGKRTPDDWLERNLYMRFLNGGVYALGFLFVLGFGVHGIWMWAVQMAFIPVMAAGVINGLGHWMGYRNYDCDDNARNILPIGLIIGGEELHNNHHAFPHSPKLSRQRWEFDIGWAWIRLFALLGLAKPRAVATLGVQGDTVKQIDPSLFQVLRNHRMDLMRGYADRVVKVAVPHIRAKDARLLTSSERWRSRAQAMRLEKLLDANEELQALYLYYREFWSVWRKQKGEAAAEQVERLRTWCKRAEASGIDALSSFAQDLRRFEAA